MLRLKAREEAKKALLNNIEFGNNWCTRFMIRKGFSCRTTIYQKLPTDFEQKLINFYRYV